MFELRDKKKVRVLQVELIERALGCLQVNVEGRGLASPREETTLPTTLGALLECTFEKITGIHDYYKLYNSSLYICSKGKGFWGFGVLGFWADLNF